MPRPSSDPSFCSSGTRATPSTGRRAQGFAPGDPLPAELINELWGVQGDWIDHHREVVSVPYIIDASGFFATSPTPGADKRAADIIGGSPAAIFTASGTTPVLVSADFTPLLPVVTDNAPIAIVSMEIFAQFAAAGDQVEARAGIVDLATGTVTALGSLLTMTGALGTGSPVSQSIGLGSVQLQADELIVITCRLSPSASPPDAQLLAAALTVDRPRAE